MICALIKMGGRGVRFGESIPKQFYEISGKPLFAYVIEQYERLEFIDKFIIVTNDEWFKLTMTYANNILGDKLLEVVAGGNTNARSTYNGIICANKYLESEDIILVHDVTDPIIESDAIAKVIECCKESLCAAVVTEQVHTLYTINKEGFITGTIEKKSVGSGYSPEAFDFKTVYDCYSIATDYELENMTSAMALVQSHGISPKVVVSHQLDLKITYKEDMDALKSIIFNAKNLYKDL